MSEEECVAWLTLVGVTGLGPYRIQQLLARYSHPQEIIDRVDELGLATPMKQQLVSPDRRMIDGALSFHAEPNQVILSITDTAYPEALRHISDPPPLLYVRGAVSALRYLQFAIVGSRRASPLGCQHAQQFAQALVESGYTVTSGLALGIDAAAHQGALSAQGKTIAVLGSGLDCLYPKRHSRLASMIMAEGALVSECPLTMPPMAMNFPRRNRIISGLALGVLVVEATLHSGSLITARHAAEQGREVFAVPGSIRHEQAAGTHWLIQQGAALVVDAAEMVAAVGGAIVPREEQQKKQTKLDQDGRNLLECVDFAVTTVEELCRIKMLPVKSVARLLTQLELNGLIKRVPGGYMRVK